MPGTPTTRRQRATVEIEWDNPPHLPKMSGPLVENRLRYTLSADRHMKVTVTSVRDITQLSLADKVIALLERDHRLLHEKIREVRALIEAEEK